MMCYNCTL